MTEKFDSAASVLPCKLKDEVMQLPAELKCRAEEIRVRCGKPLTVIVDGKERYPRGKAGDEVTSADITALMEIATQASMHSANESIKQGFLTIKGGHRIGLCGSAVMKEKRISGFRNISSAAVRIAREVRYVARECVEKICYDGRFHNTLVISPPGCGKTTFLRDAIRILADDKKNRVCVVDERCEIAAMNNSQPQFDVGYADVLENVPKAEGMIHILRSMNPEIIAIDEITAPEDIKAIETASNCGVKLIATAHADSMEDLYARPLYKKLTELEVFEKCIVISRVGNEHEYGLRDLISERNVCR